MSKPAKPAAAASKNKFVCVEYGKFDKKKVVIEDPVKSSFKKNDGTVENVTSQALYIDKDGEKRIPVFQLAPKSCFGVSPNHKYLSEKIDENIEGYQVCYSYTDLATVSSPTEEEQYGLDLMKALWELAVEKGRVEATMDEPRIPAPAVNSFAGAEAQFKKNKLAFQNAVKLPYEHPNQKDSKVKDKTKPLRSYFKLATQGKGPECRILTSFWEPGNKKANPKKFVDRRGVIEPCVMFDGVRWGAHMNAPHGASLKFVITEANFVPGSNDKLPTQRMLPANTAEPVEEDSEEEVPRPRKGTHSSAAEEDHTGDAQGFEAPDGEGDDSDPIKALKATPASSGKKVAAKPAPKPSLKPKAGATGAPTKTSGTGKPIAPSKSKTPAKPTVTPKPAAAGGGKAKAPKKEKPVAPPEEEEPLIPDESEDVEVADDDENAQD